MGAQARCCLIEEGGRDESKAGAEVGERFVFDVVGKGVRVVPGINSPGAAVLGAVFARIVADGLVFV